MEHIVKLQGHEQLNKTPFPPQSSVYVYDDSHPSKAIGYGIVKDVFVEMASDRPPILLFQVKLTSEAHKGQERLVQNTSLRFCNGTRVHVHKIGHDPNSDTGKALLGVVLGSYDIPSDISFCDKNCQLSLKHSYEYTVKVLDSDKSWKLLHAISPNQLTLRLDSSDDGHDQEHTVTQTQVHVKTEGGESKTLTDYPHAISPMSKVKDEVDEEPSSTECTEVEIDTPHQESNHSVPDSNTQVKDNDTPSKKRSYSPTNLNKNEVDFEMVVVKDTSNKKSRDETFVTVDISSETDTSLKNKGDEVETFKLHWKRIPPKHGQSHIRMNGGKTFYWCQLCSEGRGLWVNHKPEEHRDMEYEHNQGLLQATAEMSTPLESMTHHSTSPYHAIAPNRKFAACGALNIPLPARDLGHFVIGRKGMHSQALKRKIQCWLTLIGDDQWSQIRVYGDNQQLVNDGLKYLNGYIHNSIGKMRPDLNADEILRDTFYDYNILKDHVKVDTKSLYRAKEENGHDLGTKKRTVWIVVLPRVDTTILLGMFSFFFTNLFLFQVMSHRICLFYVLRPFHWTKWQKPQILTTRNWVLQNSLQRKI
jgi:hypothetical protein